MVATIKTQTRPLELKCALNTSHRFAPDEAWGHYVHVHGANTTPLASSRVYVQEAKHRGSEDDHWAYRDVVICPICQRAGVNVVFRTLRTSEEVEAGDSLETHLRSWHGAT